MEFQEAAAADASTFLKSYHHMITKIFEVSAIRIVNNYEVPKQQLSDADLIGLVIETAYNELQ
ncbi:hypothetical protein [Vibrio splendidus]|uniref:hypothetical protein n=1 Tax=Vibrio splendidus TaxID=29497 RepID=UPI000D3784FA|nr:hypothetical protein [Vibrio splendidus]PTP41170.1 hypothetical protein CWN87_17490 [Vibrio splendidus]